MAAEISGTLGLEAELEGGTRGVFDVIADDVLIFSKQEQERFPDNAEIIEALRNRQ